MQLKLLQSFKMMLQGSATHALSIFLMPRVAQIAHPGLPFPKLVVNPIVVKGEGIAFFCPIGVP
eukprot:11408202-Ditylum_brightwellii.AAC.1